MPASLYMAAIMKTDTHLVTQSLQMTTVHVEHPTQAAIPHIPI